MADAMGNAMGTITNIKVQTKMLQRPADLDIMPSVKPPLVAPPRNTG